MKLKRLVGMVLVIVAVFLIQNSVLPAIKVLRYIPNMLIIIVCAFGLSGGAWNGMYAGVLCGLLMDTVFGYRIGFYSLPYLYIGYANGICHKYFYYDNLAVPLTACAVSDFALGFYIFVIHFVLRNRMNFCFYFMNIILPELVITMVTALVLFRLIAVINARMEMLEKRRTTKFV